MSTIHDQSNISLLIGILETEFNKQTVRRPQFVDFFNDKLKAYHEGRFNYRDLQDMNKNLLSDCFQYISQQNREIEKNTMVLKPPPSSSSHTFQTPSDNIQQQRQIQRQQQRQQQQSNTSFDNYKKQYDTMLNPKKPDEIDFSDTIEDEPIQNLDSIINQTLEDRAKELQRITTTYSDKTPDWIKSSTQNDDNSNNSSNRNSSNRNNNNNNQQPMKLIIEEDNPPSSSQTSLPISILKTKQQTPSSKKVTFNTKQQPPSLSTSSVHNLLNKLKLKQSDTPSHTKASGSASTTLPFTNNELMDMEKRVYDKIEAKVEAKFAILNEKYNKLQIQYEELSMKYGELTIPSLSQLHLSIQSQSDKID